MVLHELEIADDIAVGSVVKTDCIEKCCENGDWGIIEISLDDYVMGQY